MIPNRVIAGPLPEVVGDSRYGTVAIDGELYSVTDIWANPLRWREKAYAYLAIAEYLETNKPKLPTGPGSVILASKVKDVFLCDAASGYLALGHNRLWHSVDGFTRGINPLDIEEWVPVKLVPQIDAP